jgi:Ca2+-binding EF-hand superfamily protein
LEKDIDNINEENKEVYFDDELFCKHLFNSVDTDNNGDIDIEELKVLLDQMKLFDDLKNKESAYSELFNEIDKNKNGKIEFDEFVDWWSKSLKYDNL